MLTHRLRADSLGNPFFKDEIGEPCYVMQIDDIPLTPVLSPYRGIRGHGEEERAEGVRNYPVHGQRDY